MLPQNRGEKHGLEGHLAVTSRCVTVHDLFGQVHELWM